MNPASAADVPARFDGFIVDLDGVVWLGDEPIRGAADALRALQARGKRIVYVTNDPRSSRMHYRDRLRRLGVDVVADDVVTAAAATAEFLRARNDAAGRTAFVVGSPALKAELVAVGIELLDGEAGREADVVVVGGHEGFDYEELRVAAQAVLRGARFYATGRDATFPMPDGPWPATGAVLAAVETAADRTALAVGKPERFIFEVARKRLAGCDKIAVVGDNLGSDIAGGRSIGAATILVLTGTARPEDLDGAVVQPDFVVADLAALAATTTAAATADRAARSSPRTGR